MANHDSSDVLIVGGGAAGLSLALRLAADARVTILAKAALTEGSSLYAQGGVAAVLNAEDSLEAHIEDTISAGAGLCRRETVEYVVRRGPEAIRWLIDLGVPFTREPRDNGADDYHLTREGGHSHRRVIHAADATGRALETTLEARVRAHPNIRLHEHHIAIDLITSRKLGRRGENRVLGVYALDKAAGRVTTFDARFVVLATGGASKVYLYTSNPDTSTGDGVAMAWRAGCRVANMEFVQFHPTCLYHPRAKSFLITEAVRGEGGRLLLPNGEPFMHAHDARAELAPRDIVARAIDYEMKRRGLDCVHLDISHKPAEFIRTRFPTIYARCLEFGYDITRAPIPVVPAAHYTCGGVMTDLAGRTDLAGLYAVGECACTGLHGANRLASNSLLECLVFAQAAAADIGALLPQAAPPTADLPPWDESRVTDADEAVVVSHNWDELRRFMWDYVGIVRTTKRLQRAQHRVELLKEEIREYYRNFKITNDLVELRNLVLVAELIIRSALERKESRGLHYMRDYPNPYPQLAQRDTVLTPPRPVVAGARASA
ncbi:MAG: L-aspartate oxidase [Candidatus Muproteobacteria bacterium RIFCSPHIGHO2_01_FULL_65_16]|uniref:L-aspartate oxidase n=1 Tax=Candidatus Muproteobacteria bacterium RIFCSPHIGHO2_01_FULL_65_16 TaxID=1817764 RepID=A0A1F6TPR7_9PROT|nr:MAG: L-aspartate oxidase [Candidatus Muproteobacteria bacterium RIFCSPHIGHO2_01_FULL_65_16]